MLRNNARFIFVTLLYSILYNKYVNWVWNIIKRSFVPCGLNHPVSCFIPPATPTVPRTTQSPSPTLPTALLFLLLFFLLLNVPSVSIESTHEPSKLSYPDPLHYIFLYPPFYFFYLRVLPILSVFFSLSPFQPGKLLLKLITLKIYFLCKIYCWCILLSTEDVTSRSDLWYCLCYCPKVCSGHSLSVYRYGPVFSHRAWNPCNLPYFMTKTWHNFQVIW